MNVQYGGPKQIESVEQLKHHSQDISRHIKAFMGDVGPWILERETMADPNPPSNPLSLS